MDSLNFSHITLFWSIKFIQIKNLNYEFDRYDRERFYYILLHSLCDDDFFQEDNKTITVCRWHKTGSKNIFLSFMYSMAKMHTRFKFHWICMRHVDFIKFPGATPNKLNSFADNPGTSWIDISTELHQHLLHSILYHKTVIIQAKWRTIY